MFERFRRKSAASRLFEEQIYEQVVKELGSGQRREGLWAKALAKSEGVEAKAKALYIRYRVQSIKDEMEIDEAMKEEAVKARDSQSTDAAEKARSNGLSEDDIAYLGKPIRAEEYKEKYGASEAGLKKAISQGKIRGVISRGVLWVQDKRYA